MRKQTLYSQRRAEEERNITEKSHAIRNKMQEKAAMVDDLTTSAGKCLAYGGMVAGGMILGAVASLGGWVIVLVVVLGVAAAALGGMAYFGLRAKKLINTPVAVAPDGTPLVM